MDPVTLPTPSAASVPEPDAVTGTAAVGPGHPPPARLGRLPRPTPLWWRDVTGAAAWALVVFVVGLWVAGGGVEDLTGGTVADVVTTLGRLTGLLASVLVLLQLLVIARIPVVEQAWGQDELLAVHRLVGFTSISLMLVHVLATVVGYSLGTGAGVVTTFVDEVLHAPGMLLALAGLVAFVMVAVTSVRRARRRLRYESWHLLHLYAYLGAGLALPHQLWTGADFLDSEVATIFWWGLWGASVLAVLVWRVGVPLYRTLRHRLVVTEVVREAPGVTSVVMEGRALDRLPARAGQFFEWRFLDGPGWTRAHPYSLSAVPDGRGLRVTVAHEGDGSARLAALRPGTKVAVEGPYGRLHSGVKVARGTVLVAGGIGIAPMRALLEELPAGPGETVLIYRVGRDQDVVLGRELLDLAATKGARIVAVTGHRDPARASWLPATAAHVGDAEALLQIVPDIADRDVFVCGAPAWMDRVVVAAREAGVPAAAVHRERFSW